MSIEVLNKTLWSLRYCMVETMKEGGRNSYRVSHMRTDKLQRQKTLHVHLYCDFVLLEFVKFVSNVLNK